MSICTEIPPFFRLIIRQVYDTDIRVTQSGRCRDRGRKILGFRLLDLSVKGSLSMSMSALHMHEEDWYDPRDKLGAEPIGTIAYAHQEASNNTRFAKGKRFLDQVSKELAFRLLYILPRFYQLDNVKNPRFFEGNFNEREIYSQFYASVDTVTLLHMSERPTSKGGRVDIRIHYAQCIFHIEIKSAPPLTISFIGPQNPRFNIDAENKWKRCLSQVEGLVGQKTNVYPIPFLVSFVRVDKAGANDNNILEEIYRKSALHILQTSWDVWQGYGAPQVAQTLNPTLAPVPIDSPNWYFLAKRGSDRVIERESPKPTVGVLFMTKIPV